MRHDSNMNSFVNIFTLVLMTSSGFLEDALVKKKTNDDFTFLIREQLQGN